MNIDIEVAYAGYESQTVLALKVPVGTTAVEAVVRSGILEQYPEINLERNKIGVFGRAVASGYELQMHDRVEIYRPLRCDPKASRRRRARRARLDAC